MASPRPDDQDLRRALRKQVGGNWPRRVRPNSFCRASDKWESCKESLRSGTVGGKGRTCDDWNVSEIVYIIGNGLSIGVSEHFSVASLTNRLTEALDPATSEALAQVANLGRPDSDLGAPTASLGFEDYAGPIDRIAAAVRTLAPLAGAGAEGGVLWQAYEYLRRRYVQLVGLVLTEITGSAHLADSEKWQRLNAFTDALWALQSSHSSAVFTLSYDTLLESSMLESGRGWFYDGFAGRQLNYPLDRRAGTIGVYHLHGSALWYERPNGDIGKVRSDSFMRDALLQEWSRGDETYGLPVVVLTDLKTRAASQYPFDLFYQELWSELSDASTVVMAGYGFRDVPVNRVIKSWLTRPNEAAGRLEVWSTDGTRGRDRATTALDLDDGLRSRVYGYSVTLPDAAAIAALGERQAR